MKRITHFNSKSKDGEKFKNIQLYSNLKKYLILDKSIFYNENYIIMYSLSSMTLLRIFYGFLIEAQLISKENLPDICAKVLFGCVSTLHTGNHNFALN